MTATTGTTGTTETRIRSAAGRQGGSVGTYVCADLACARHVTGGAPPVRQELGGG